jgi:hypothetical protein
VTDATAETLVVRYLRLGLALGRHVDGLVDAYYGPPELAARAQADPLVPPGRLAATARALLAELDAGAPLDREGPDHPRRRRWLRAQLEGLLATAEVLSGAALPYAEEVERCYGVRPEAVPDEQVREAHRRLDEALPGRGPLLERYTAWREAQAVPPDRLEAAVSSLASEFRARTAQLFGLPEGEAVAFELVREKPWSGFNYYLGGLRSTVAVNLDLPVLATSLGHLVAHEAYPGHHTEHSRKEAELVRRRGQLEETLFVVGTPQCLVSEGLADLGLEVVAGPRPEAVVAEQLRPLGVRYDAELAAEVAGAAEVLAAVRANAALRLHEDRADPAEVVEELGRAALLSRPRAEKAVEFLLHPTWRAYVTCYVEGLKRCRRFVAGRPERFARLLSEQLTPADLDASDRP